MRRHLAAGLRYLGAGLIDGDLEIPRIEIHQRIAGFHDLVVIDVNLGDGAVDARTDGVQVSVHLGVVSGFEFPRLEPKVNADPGGDQQHQEENDEGAATAASGGRRIRLVVHGPALARAALWVSWWWYSWANSSQQIGKVGLGLAHGAGQSDAGQVESEQRVKCNRFPRWPLVLVPAPLPRWL